MIKILLFSLLVFANTEHVTFTGVECFPDKGVIRLFLKLNYTDFVFDYRHTINDDQNFDPSGKIDTTEILVTKYLNNQLQIFADDKKLKGQLTDFKYINGELNMSVLYYFNKRTTSFRLRNTILTGPFKDQTNMLIFKYNNQEEGVKLTTENPERTFLVK